MRISPVLPVYNASELSPVAARQQQVELAELPPMLAYRGHGMVEHAAPTQSIAYVMAHERAHAASYRTRALQEGYELTDEGIDVRFELRDGVLIAVGGEARATFTRREQPDQSAPNPKPPAGSAVALGSLEEERSSPGKSLMPAVSLDDSVSSTVSAARDLDNARWAAAARVRAAEEALRQLPGNPGSPDVREAAKRAELDRAEAEAVLKDVEVARQTMMLLRSIADLSSLIAGAVEAQTKVAAKIAYAALGR